MGEIVVSASQLRQVCEETGLSERTVRVVLLAAARAGVDLLGPQLELFAAKEKRKMTILRPITSFAPAQVPENTQNGLLDLRPITSFAPCEKSDHTQVGYNTNASEEEEEQRASSSTVGRRRGEPRTALPDGVTLSARWRFLALELLGAAADVDRIFDHFVAHHQAHGNRMARWEAAWRTWLHRERPRGAGPDNGGGALAARYLRRQGYEPDSGDDAGGEAAGGVPGVGLERPPLRAVRGQPGALPVPRGRRGR